MILFALSTVASIIVPSELNRKGGGAVRARASANRLLSWGAVLGGVLGGLQLAGIPYLSVLTPLPEVPPLTLTLTPTLTLTLSLTLTPTLALTLTLSLPLP